jgi:hypothetical protein
MQVTSGSTWKTENGDTRSYSLSLDTADLQLMHVDVSDWKVSEILSELNLRADMLVITYMQAEGGIPKSFASARLLELKGKLPSLKKKAAA